MLVLVRFILWATLIKRLN